MPQSIETTLLATVQTVITLESADADHDASGFFVGVKKGSNQTVTLGLKGKDSTSHARITGVRSVPTPDSGQGPWTHWTLIDGVYVLPQPLGLGATIRVEVDNNHNAPTPPQGGGHFRVVEEGGSFVLAAAPHPFGTPHQGAQQP